MSDRPSTQAVTVLVTGFERFNGITGDNQSFIVATLLPSYLPATSAYKTPVNIIFHPYPIRVSYDEVSTLASSLYDAYQDKVDMVLHLGLTTSEQHYSLEESADRDGYDAYNDVDQKKFSTEDGHNRWPEGSDTLKTTLDVEAIYNNWRSNLLRTPEALSALDGIVVRRSSGKGTFICDFLYYATMAEYTKRRMLAASAMEARPVMFLHVPGRSSLNNIKQGRVVVMMLIRSMAESWANRSDKRANSPMEI
ncbi:hypothetical protein MBLNU457_2375t1 [Dothideomycetes sp. NU457]